VISQLVRIAIGRSAMKATRRVLGQGEPSDAALGRVQDLILDELDQPILLNALRGEHAMLTELIRRQGSGEVPISALSAEPQKFQPGGFRATISPLTKPWFDIQRAVGLEWMNAAVAIERQPVAERPALWKAWDAEVTRVKGSRHGVFTAMLPLLLVPSISSTNPAFASYRGELGATAILLAAERHRRKTGAWPASIADIDRGILPNPPLDLFSGRAFLMERRDGKLFIHSIGPNRKDEHGAYDPKKWTTLGPDDIGAVAWDVNLRRQSFPGENDGAPASAPPP
jgi:hypothetical protein